MTGTRLSEIFGGQQLNIGQTVSPNICQSDGDNALQEVEMVFALVKPGWNGSVGHIMSSAENIGNQERKVPVLLSYTQNNNNNHFHLRKSIHTKFNSTCKNIESFCIIYVHFLNVKF